MSIASYSELKTAIGNWLNRSDLTSYLPDFIMLGEKRIYRDLRIRAMETALSSAISSGSIALPTGYVELKYAYVDGSPTQFLQRRSAEQLYLEFPTRSSDGKPSVIVREGETFIFGPYPDSNYTIKGIYYKKLDALSDSNTTNWFTSNAPDLLLFSALIEAEPFLGNDARLEMWEKKYQQKKAEIISEDDAENLSGSAPRQTVSYI